MTRTFHCTRGRSRKFWSVDVDEPASAPPCAVVRVQFGRIGTAGQSHIKIFNTAWAATRYYHAKISEKLGKDYYEVSESAQPATAPVKLPPCPHSQLGQVRARVWKCLRCGDEVEFGEVQIASEDVIEKRARRFFNVDALEKMGHE